MPFDRPTLPELIDEGATEIESRLPGVLVRLRRSLVGVLNRVFNGALSTLYQYVEWLIRQAWPDTAEKEFLDGHGARWGVTRTPAAKAGGTGSFPGTNGVAVPAGTVVQRGDGFRYTVFADATVTGGVVGLILQAVAAGQDGNASTGVALTLSSPIDGVNSSGLTTSAMAGGADLQEDEPYRARILARIRKPPQGGADFDYEAWAREVPGVTRVWVSPLEPSLGWVTVRFMRDDDPTPIPDAGEVAATLAHIDALRPVTARLSVQAPIGVLQNFSIAVTPNTVAVKAAVQAELAAMILRDAKPGGTLLLSHIREAISIASGEDNHVLTFPTADVVYGTGQMAQMGGDHVGLTPGAWLQALQAHLPPGRALTREPGAWLTRLLEAFAAMLLTAQLRFTAVVAQFDPLLATDLLPDWERLLALPDTCMANVVLSVADRQRIAAQRLLEQGGQSRAYFIDLAERLGEPGCTITEFRPMTCNDDCNDALYGEADIFVWQLNIPHPALNARPMNCNDNCTDALQLYQPSLVECPIRERKPAHTEVIFSYA